MLSQGVSKNQRKYSYFSSKNKVQSEVPRSLILPSSQQLYKVIKDLQNIIKQQQQKRAQIQQQLFYYKNRNVERQTQFLSVIEKYQKHQQIVTEQNPQIDLLYNKILGYFDQFNSQTSQVIQKKYSQSMETMNRRIKQILLLVEEEIKKIILKVKTMPTTVFYDIKKLQETTRVIENKNYQVMEVIDKVKYQNSILKSERDLLLNDAITNKIKQDSANRQNIRLKIEINTLKQQNKKLKQLNQYESRPTSAKKIMNTMQKISSQSKINQNKFRYDRVNNTTQDKSSIRSSYQFKNIDEILQQTNLIKNKQQINYLTPTKNIVRTPRYFKNQSPSTCQTKRLSSQLTFQFPNTKSKLKNQNNNEIVIQNKNNYLDGSNFSSQIITPKTNALSKQTKQKQYSYMNTIQNLQKTLKREKVKVNSLGNIITKLNLKNKQVNEFIEQIMKQFESEEAEKDRIFNKNLNETILSKLKLLKENICSAESQQGNKVNFDL